MEVVFVSSRRRRSLYLFQSKIRLREYEKYQKHLQGKVCLDNAFFVFLKPENDS